MPLNICPKHFNTNKFLSLASTCMQISYAGIFIYHARYHNKTFYKCYTDMYCIIMKENTEGVHTQKSWLQKLWPRVFSFYFGKNTIHYMLGVILSILLTVFILLFFRGLTCSALDHRSLPPEFEFRRGHIWRVYHLSLRFITFGGRSAYLAYHVHKSGRKSSIVNHHQSINQNLVDVLGINIWYMYQLIGVVEKYERNCLYR